MEDTINQRIVNLRKAKRLTQKQFAEKLNVSDKLVSKWEQEGSTPALEEVVNISKIFNLSLDYLIHGKKSKSDEVALTPLPPPPPPFVDPIQTLVKKIDDLINKNKLQKYKEQLFPSSSEDALYDMSERVRKATLEDWRFLLSNDAERFETDGYKCYIYRGDYVEDRRGPKKLIDEKYWAQVEDSSENYCIGGIDHISKEDRHLLNHGFGVFIIKDFGHSSLKDICNGNDREYRLVNYDISFSINFNALLALDNFEIYSKLTSSGIPLCMNLLPPSQAKKSSGYFDLTFEETKYYEILNKSVYGVNVSAAVQDYLNYLRGGYGYGVNKPKLEDDYILRDLSKAPITYNELLGLTDVRFFSLLPKNELDILLDKVKIKHKRVWEVIAALIEYGATKKKLVKKDKYGDFVEVDDALGTFMLYEIAKMKTANKE